MRVLLLLFLAGVAYGEHISESKFRQALRAKCNNNAHNENAYEEVQQLFVDYHECVRSIFNKLPPNPVEDHEGFCNYLRNSGFYGCVEGLTSGVTPCLDDSEKYLPHLLLHGVNSTYDELCGVNGIANSNLIFNQLTAKNGCSGLNSLSFGEWSCLYELDVIKNLQNGVLSFNKHNVCLDLDKFQSCMKSMVERICPDGQYSEIIDLIFIPFTEECNDLVHG